MTDVDVLFLLIVVLSTFSAIIVFRLVQIERILEDLRADLAKLETGRHE
jgi:hypothetical protein